MLAILIALTIVSVAAIAGWATVASAHALGRGSTARRDPELARRLEDLHAAVAELRAEIDQLATQQEDDRQLLEERLDFAERLLTRGRDETR